MKFLFLIKVGHEHGLGHYARSKSLATHLKKKGHRIIFWVVGDSLNLKKEFDVIEKEILEDSSFFREYIVKNNIDVLYVDSNFLFNKKIFLNIRSEIPIVFYQNLSVSKTLCDVFINPYPYDSRINSVRKSSNIKLYEGFKFYIIRDEVRELNRDLTTSDEIETITITTGGSDPNFILEKICARIDFEFYSNLNFRVLVGSSFDRERVQKLKTAYKFPHLSFPPFSLTEIMDSDFIISTLGVSVFEFFYLGKPVACVSIDQRADKIGQYLEEHKFLTNLGPYKQIDQESVNRLLNQLTNNIASFRTRAGRAKMIIDGKGLERVSKILENL